MESMGGSIWQLVAEHIDAVVPKGLNGSPSNRIRGSEENDSDDESSSSGSDSDDEPERRAQRVALACEDGVVRIFEVAAAQHGLAYQKSFPRVKGEVYVKFLYHYSLVHVRFIVFGAFKLLYEEDE